MYDKYFKNILYLKQKKIVFIFVTFLLMLFCITKLIRGTNIETDSYGGIWNAISLAFYPIMFLFLLINKHRMSLLFSVLFLYSIFAFFTTIANNNLIFIQPVEFYNLLMIPYFILVFSTFYLSSCSCNFAKKIILFTFLSCLLINIITVFGFRFLGWNRPLATDVYFSLGLFPFSIIFLKNNKLKLLCTVLLIILIFFSAKRAGIFALGTAIISYFTVQYIITKQKNILKNIINIIILFSFILIFYYIFSYIDNLYNFGIYDRIMATTADKGSGRIDLYLSVLNNFMDSSLFDQFFGHGMYATLDLTGVLAHNDFIEILYDYGIVSLLLIFIFYFILLNIGYKMIKNRSPFASIFISTLFVEFILSMFSFMLVFYTYITCFMSFLGYCIAMEEKRLIQ